MVFMDQEVLIMIIESFLLAVPAVGLTIAAVAVVAIGYMLASCATARLMGKACS